MILVIGGRGAGKRSFVTDVLGFSPEQFAENGPVLYGLATGHFPIKRSNCKSPL